MKWKCLITYRIRRNRGPTRSNALKTTHHVHLRFVTNQNQDQIRNPKSPKIFSTASYGERERKQKREITDSDNSNSHTPDEQTQRFDSSSSNEKTGEERICRPCSSFGFSLSPRPNQVESLLFLSLSLVAKANHASLVLYLFTLLVKP